MTEMKHEPPENQLKDRGKILPVVGLVLLVVIVPFLCLGWFLEPAVARWTASDWFRDHWFSTGILTILLLVADIFLPIPSSLVGTIAGTTLGFAAGTFFVWTGLSLAAGLGYWVARLTGPGILSTRQRQIVNDHQLSIERLGPWFLVLFRAVPVAAEATVLFAGLSRMPGKVFWPAILGSNLGVAAAFVSLGSFAQLGNFPGLALAISLSLPAGLTAWLLFRNGRPARS